LVVLQPQIRTNDDDYLQQLAATIRQ
jgi:hypothetical protein